MKSVVEKPKFDIEDLIGVTVNRPKRFYESYHSGSSIFRNENFNLIASDRAIGRFCAQHCSELPIPNCKQIRQGLLNILCAASGSRRFFLFPQFVMIQKIGQVTGWFTLTHSDRCPFLKVDSIVTMGDYYLYQAVRQICVKHGLCKDLTWKIYCI